MFVFKNGDEVYLKPYDEVKRHSGIRREVWDILNSQPLRLIRLSYPHTAYISTTIITDTTADGTWYVNPTDIYVKISKEDFLQYDLDDKDIVSSAYVK